MSQVTGEHKQHPFFGVRRVIQFYTETICDSSMFMFYVRPPIKLLSSYLKEAVCASIFHPRADGSFPLFLPFSFSHR